MNLETKLKKVVKKWVNRKGLVKNHSSEPIWVIETSSNPTTAHLLYPKHKTPFSIDIDGFRRVDGGSINGFRYWWKIRDPQKADIYDKKRGIRAVCFPYMKKAKKDEFGKDSEIKYDRSKNWNVPLKYIVDVRRNKFGKITHYLVEKVGWVEKEKAITMVARDEIDNATVVSSGKGAPFLKTFPDRKITNNFSEMK